MWALRGVCVGHLWGDVVGCAAHRVEALGSMLGEAEVSQLDLSVRLASSQQ